MDEDEECVCKGEILINTPTLLKNGNIIIPNASFLRESPFSAELKSSNSYKFAMRYSLSQFLDVRILRDENIIEWKFTNMELLTDSEIKKLGGEMLLKESDNRISIQHTPLPDDVDFTQRVEFIPHDTTSGKLMEVIVRKRIEYELSFSSPRSENHNLTVKSTEKLSNTV